MHCLYSSFLRCKLIYNWLHLWIFCISCNLIFNYKPPDDGTGRAETCRGRINNFKTENNFIMSCKIYKISITVTNCKYILSFKNQTKDSAFSWIIVHILYPQY
jgi:hypothetical protein